jgi:hypothetical protein
MVEGDNEEMEIGDSDGSVKIVGKNRPALSSSRRELAHSTKNGVGFS